MVGLNPLVRLTLVAATAAPIGFLPPPSVPPADPLAVVSTMVFRSVDPAAPYLSSSVLPPLVVPPVDDRAQVASLMVVGVRNFEDADWALSQGAGGIFIGSWTDPSILTQQGRNVHALRAKHRRPFTVAIDAEGGRVQRQPALFGQIPSARTLAATKSPAEVRVIASELGRRLAAYGITTDFAPLVDVSDAPAGDVIGDRSFSADPNKAAVYASAFAQGLFDAGITPVFKHFPGHGRAHGDSHTGAAVTPPLEELKRVDLKPYGTVLTAHPSAGVMMGHLSVPGLTGSLPASVDPAAYGLVRTGAYPGGVPFGGVIWTDDMSGMRAITNTMSVPDAVTRAIAAGADRVLWVSTADLPESIDAVLAAVRDGRISRPRLATAAWRVALSYR